MIRESGAAPDQSSYAAVIVFSGEKIVGGKTERLRSGDEKSGNFFALLYFLGKPEPLGSHDLCGELPEHGADSEPVRKDVRPEPRDTGEHVRKSVLRSYACELFHKRLD